VRLYDWLNSEVFPEDRPSEEEVQDDKKLDEWLVRYEREQAQQASLRKADKLKRKLSDGTKKKGRRVAQ